MTNDDNVIKADVESGFKEIETQLRDSNPGVAELLSVYATYEDAIRSTDAFFAALDPEPQFSATNSCE